MSELSIFVKPLLLTLFFEVGTAWCLGMRNRKDLLLVVLVNILTNPPLVLLSNFLMYYLGIGRGQLFTYLILEVLVVYIEYRIYKACLLFEFDPFKLSLILNGISILGGLLCQLF